MNHRKTGLFLLPCAMKAPLLDGGFCGANRHQEETKA